MPLAVEGRPLLRVNLSFVTLTMSPCFATLTV